MFYKKGDYMNKKVIALVLAVIIILIAGIFIISEITNKPYEKPYENTTKITALVYYLDSSGIKLQKTDTEIILKESENKYKKVLEKLIEGPSYTNLHSTIDKRTVINSVTLNNDICTVDFSESFTEYNTGGSLRELLCVYSVVNTLCQFEEINKVSFMVNGSKIESFGELDMSGLYEEDLSYTK